MCVCVGGVSPGPEHEALWLGEGAHCHKARACCPPPQGRWRTPTDHLLLQKGVGISPCWWAWGRALCFAPPPHHHPGGCGRTKSSWWPHLRKADLNFQSRDRTGVSQGRLQEITSPFPDPPSRTQLNSKPSIFQSSLVLEFVYIRETPSGLIPGLSNMISRAGFVMVDNMNTDTFSRGARSQSCVSPARPGLFLG